MWIDPSSPFKYCGQTFRDKERHMVATQKARKASKRVDRRKTTSTRITPETRLRLEEAAKDANRSLAQEIEMRLERSFAEEANLQWAYEQFIGDEALHRAIMMASSLIRISQDETGVPWHRDSELRKEAADLYLRQLNTEAAKLNADADKRPSSKTHKRPARKRVVRK